MGGIEINGVSYDVQRISSSNRNATARLKGRTIIISLPSRWPGKDREEIGSSLLRRAVRAIEKGRWRPEGRSKLEFRHGQRITAMGREFRVSFVHSERALSRLDGDNIEVRMPAIGERIPLASDRAKRILAREVGPLVAERAERFNRAHFNSEIRTIILRDNTSIWGSCSRDGRLSINLRLVFMPQEILDYVIVHELAHTKYRSHGPRFWALVEKVLPDHKERRKWLRENGWGYPKREPEEAKCRETNTCQVRPASALTRPLQTA